MRLGSDPDDPLTRALAPPPNETPHEREDRLRREAEAQRISDEIDEGLRVERAALKKRKPMKMLLLGQSESGKSTTLKNMQLAYTPKAWAAERASWRAVIQLNLIRSVNAIIEALAAELASAGAQSSSSPTPYSVSSHGHARPQTAPSNQDTSDAVSIPHDHRAILLKLRFRLSPLGQVESDLKTRLGAGTDEVCEAMFGGADSDGAMMATPFDETSYSVPTRRSGSKELVVRSHKVWKDKENSWKQRDASLSSSSRPASAHRSLESERDSATDVLAGCADDMVALWQDPVVQEIISKRKVVASLGDSAEYFLNNAARIATREYEPSDNDVLRARIRTLGVQEYSLVFEAGNDRDIGKEWVIYDVGGSRTSRAAWFPYFSDIHAILFLAPISGFDESLAEDRRVNRLEDSFILWQSIVKEKLLKDVVIILFMNKCDLLEKKLKSGIMIKKHMTSYAERGNDVATFGTYLRHKFKELLVNLSPEKRPFYGYMTSVIDADATATTLASVRDGILQAHLKSATFVV